MKIDEIRELIQMLEQSSLTALEVCQGDSRLRLERAGQGAIASTASAPATVPVVPATPAAPAQAVQPAAPVGKPVVAPMVGVFYAAAAPEDEPFVQVGKMVKKGEALCIIEAMKLMNEITAEQDGVITEVCVQNGQVVEFGQPLFYLQ